jgi:hypothetical protein
MIFYAIISLYLATFSLAANFSVGQTFQIVLDRVPDLNYSLVPDAQVWDIDLFDAPISTISGLKAQGKVVVCYFSAGTYEDWRSDANLFQQQDLGKSLGMWPGEYWLDTRSTGVRSIMAKRIQLAVSKGCDAIDPDNTGEFGLSVAGKMTLI